MRKLMLAAAAALTLAAMPAAAVTLYDSGEGTIGFVNLADGNRAAARIVFGSDVTITGLEGFILAVEDADFRVSIYTDDASELPGSELFGADFAENGNTAAAGWSGAGGLSWALDAGAYWVVLKGMEPVNTPTGSVWGWAPNPLVRYAASTTNVPGKWILQPTSAALALRITGEGGGPISGGDPLPPGVPEPSTWALLIGGFGMAGAALRRRRAALA